MPAVNYIVVVEKKKNILSYIGCSFHSKQKVMAAFGKIKPSNSAVNDWTICEEKL